ncbi:hypothetical protein BpHYR1_053261 [Brachionus plicatilis]|uniref:Uncharacterized protein n=1 Tax=Brachionus plicatilis TaxID=10195 RepID=A0A3M7T166_BRAPC|nr:hypothetical protein BpHYR1_053261 [Brachionus plicatilis]
MDQMLKSHRFFHLNKEGFVLSNLDQLLRQFYLINNINISDVGYEWFANVGYPIYLDSKPSLYSFTRRTTSGTE